MKILFYSTIVLISMILFSCSQNAAVTVQQWQEAEISFQSSKHYDNPYTDVEFYVEFYGPGEEKIIRPGFYDGDNTWKVRFAPPSKNGKWTYLTFCSSQDDSGLHGKAGIIQSTPYSGSNRLIKHGFLRMSEGYRNIVHADGSSFLLVGDTPWALPWRATYSDVQTYAKDRRNKGFNAALLMVIQPDRDAEGPDARNTEQGFARAFDDIKDGHINKINTDYFQYLDSIINILIDHEIVPVYQPVFHGFGWKGQNVLGWDMDAQEYARFTRYLVARYGAKPAVWLVSADSHGKDTGVLEAGKTVEEWDSYQQPTGIHYNPFDEAQPEWGNKGAHFNKTHQDKEWLDFQWCQTGHSGEHLYHKVEKMYNNLPIKAVANGEPTYEGIRRPDNGAGWWQGEEAWMQLMSGGTMGVVYGAGGLWNWKITANEIGWPDWANSNVSWKQALDLEGSTFVGYVGKALKKYDITDIEKKPELANGKPLLAKPGLLYISYLNTGGEISISGLKPNLPYQWFNPKNGEFQKENKVKTSPQTFTAPDDNPWVLIIGNQKNKLKET